MKKRSTSTARKRPAAKPLTSVAGTKLRVVFTEAQIRRRVRQLAEQLNRDYRGRTLHVVGVLENCFMFMADLVRSLKIPGTCQFLKAEIHDSSAGGIALREIMYTP